MEGDIAVVSANYGMNTFIQHKVFGERAEEAIREAKKEAARLEGLLSRFIPDSEISRLNMSAGRRQERLSPETLEVLSKALEFSSLSRGSFDITVGPMVDLWKRAGKELSAPSAGKISKLLSVVNYRDLILNFSEGEAFLKKKGQSVDLGGIGKGYAADKVLEVMRGFGITSAFTNFGGNVAAIGTKPDGSPWRVGIQHPRQDNRLIGSLCITDSSVVTSGDYQRYFMSTDGKRYHHILDPATGYPSESGLISATVITGNSMAADALSTVLFVLGLKKGTEILKSYPEVEAVLIDKDLQIYITEGLKNNFRSEEGIDIKILVN